MRQTTCAEQHLAYRCVRCCIFDAIGKQAVRFVKQRHRSSHGEKVTKHLKRNCSNCGEDYRYHYLGHKPLPGAQLRYFVTVEEQIIAALGFGAAAWQTAPRDQFIGWSHKQRERNLPLIINNARFLILPWVRSKNLASKILSMVARRLPDDWESQYKIRPVLLETFVDSERFIGTCYKASNWVYVGKTKGRGKLGRAGIQSVPIKDIWLHPLSRHFRRQLTD